jgi:hypothetical protein
MVSSVKNKKIVKITCYIYTHFCLFAMDYKKFRGKLGEISIIYAPSDLHRTQCVKMRGQFLHLMDSKAR